MAANGWWDERVLPRLNHRALDGADVERWRRPVCERSSGAVLEIGFGSGPNLPLYPESVSSVLVAEPSDLAWELATERIAAFGRPVSRVSTDAASLVRLTNDSVDAVVSTWSMCTVPDLRRALAEVRRVLRRGGALHFVEHSAAPDRRTAGVQRRIQPVWGRMAGGCHLDRDLPRILEDAGFDVRLDQARYVTRGPLRPWGYFVTGTAVPSSSASTPAPRHPSG